MNKYKIIEKQFKENIESVVASDVLVSIYCIINGIEKPNKKSNYMYIDAIAPSLTQEQIRLIYKVKVLLSDNLEFQKIFFSLNESY